MHFILPKLTTILLSFGFLLQALYFKKKHNTLIFPAALFSLFWFVFSIIPLLALISVPITPHGLGYIFLCSVFFSISSVGFNWIEAFENNKKKKETNTSSFYFDSMALKSFFWLCFLLALATATFVVTRAGFSLSETIFNFHSTSQKFSSLRFFGKIDYGIIGSLSFLFTYLTALIGGLVYFNKLKTLKFFFFVILSLFPTFYFMLIQSAKIILFNSIGFYISGTFVRIIFNDFSFHFNKKNIIFLILFFLMSLILIIISISTRHDQKEFLALIIVSSKAILGYAFGQLYAFSDFFNHLIGSNSLNAYTHELGSYGKYTFTSIYSLLIEKVNFPPGTYYDYYNYNNFIMTNIFTFFRGLINDFGIFGTMLFMYLSGLVIHFFYFRLLKYKFSYLSISFFILSMLFIINSYMFSIFMSRIMFLFLISSLSIFWINHIFVFYLQSQDSKS